MFPIILPFTVKSPGIVMLLPERIKLPPDKGSILFTLNVLMIYFLIFYVEATKYSN